MSKKKLKKIYKLIDQINIKLGLKFIALVKKFQMELLKKWKKEEKNG